MPTRSNEQLCAEWKNGNRAALDELVKQNFPFVRREAIIQANHFQRRDLMDDLIQEGSIGLIEAAERFDANRENSFLTYAAHKVRKHILEYLKTETAIEIISLPESDTLIELTELIAAESWQGQSPEQLVINAETIAELHHAMAAISDRDAAYLRYRFGFPDEPGSRTRKATAEHFHLSQSRAKSTEEAVLDNLRLELPWW
ncbi:MAG: sigma-70 family RNA polymerase sigma factor [Acidaminococcaceae bacterium]|nr:sigma-70 family RNA polymerase sigma factor [Acidaminococcaceae bacterium]